MTRRSDPHPEKHKGARESPGDGTITTDQPDQMWGMDATSCLTREGTATVFVVVDHCAAECIGLHAAKPGTRFEAVEPLRQGVHALFGGYSPGSTGDVGPPGGARALCSYLFPLGWDGDR